jgi:hypothetical protein
MPLSMAARTNQDLLDRCNDAIAKVMGGVQSYIAPDGSQAQYPALKDLLATRAELQSQVDQENAGGGGFVQMGGSEISGI